MKAIEMIGLKLYPELEVQTSVKIVIDKILKLANNPGIERRANGFHQITHLKDLLNDEN